MQPFIINRRLSLACEDSWPNLYSFAKQHLPLSFSSTEEQTTTQGGPGTAGPPPPSPGAAGRRLMSGDTSLLLHPSSSSSSSSRQLRPRTPEPSSRGLRGIKDLNKPGRSGLLKPLPKWDEDRPSKGQVKRVTKDMYKHAFESARKAEERKFKAKFDDLVNDLHHALNKHSSHGLVDTFASTSYGDVLLSFRGHIKDLLIVFTRRLQLAYESFDSQDTAEDHSQQVKQNVSGFLEDLLGESLDLTSDEAVSDLSSLSDDSANDRHAFEDQLSQAVVSKIIENHRRDVHHGLRNERHHLSDSCLIPEARDDDDIDGDDDNDENDSSARRNCVPKDIDISKDFADLKHFVEETQSHSKRYEDNVSAGVDSYNGDEEVTDFRGPHTARASSSFNVRSTERDFPSLPDFSDLEQIDFESGEMDPDLLQMNLAVIPEETEEELEQEEAEDSQWRENWIFKGHGPPPPSLRLRGAGAGGGDQPPQYMAVPTPDDRLAPRVGNRDVDQLSDLLDNDDDDDRSFYPRTSEELARISKYKRSSSPPSLLPTSLIPSSTNDLGNNSHDSPPQNSLTLPRKKKSSTEVYDLDVDLEDVTVGSEDFVGPIVEPSQKELKLLDSLVPADEDDPKFLEAPESVTIQEGEPVKFSCRVSGTQPIDVFWYREQAEVEELEEGEDVEFQEGEGGRHNATLYHVGRQHAGQYMCIALNDQGKAIQYLTVTVKDNKQELKKPEFLKELKDVEVFEGQSVKFRCKVKGYPPPRIHWYKDGSLLTSNKSCRIEKFGNRDYLLTLDHVTMEEDAEYMVVARNVAGQVKSSVQLIVEPREEGHPISPVTTASPSLTPLHTDSSDSEKPTSAFISGDSHRDMTASAPDRVRASSGKVQADSSREEPARDVHSGSRSGSGGILAGSMLVSAEELDIVNQHLEDLERHLSVEEGECAPTPEVSPDQSADPLMDTLPNNAAGRGETARKTPRKLTSNTLSVLKAAEEIIQQEKQPAGPSSTEIPPHRDSTPASTAEDFSPRRPTDPQDFSPRRPTPSDLATSGSSGYGSTSMTSSGLDFPDSGRAGSPSQGDPLSSPQDDFAMYLPSLGDENGSGSYREEVSISLSGTKTPKTEKPGAAFSSAPPAMRAVPQPSRRWREPSSTSSTSSARSASQSGSTVVPPAQKHSLSQQQQQQQQQQQEEPSGSVKDRADSWSKSAESADLVLNFGPKDVNAAAYSRDYELPYSSGRDPTGSDSYHHHHHHHHHSSISGRPSSPAQISPRSAQGGGNSSSNSSTLSTSRESLDSGVSCTPHTTHPEPRPPPVHMVGETREEEVPESRAEYDADSGVELPSVSRLKAMFGSSEKGRKGGGRDEPLPYGDGGSFKRDSPCNDIHSITARSLTKDQLQKLREGGNPQHREGRVQSRSTIQLNTPQSPQTSSTPHAVSGNQTSKTASVLTLTPSSEQAQKEAHASVPRRQIRTLNPSEHQQQDSSSRLVFPNALNPAAASNSSVSRSRINSPRPKSAIIEGTVLSVAAASPVTPRTRAQSESDSADGAAALTYKPKIRSGNISARAAFWERRILQGEDADETVDDHDDFPDMLEDGQP
ncbi:hypothetical protein ACOMHN_059375 [Nucella lapillus]